MTYDTIVVGGGPAGLSAAIHLGWHNRKVLVIDRKTGPLFFVLGKLYNVPGMPAIRGIDLQKRLRQHAEEMGVEIINASVTQVAGKEGNFSVGTESGREWHCKTLLLATGIARYHPTVDGDHRQCHRYAGKGNMHYCPDCEAPEIQGKDTLVISSGPADWGAGMAVGLSRYTSKLRLLLTVDTAVSDQRRKQMREKNIAIVQGEIKELVGKKGILSGVLLKDGTKLTADAFFVSSSAHGRTDLAQQLGIELAPSGSHVQPKTQRGDTNVPGVWIAGDLRPMTQQVSVAMGTGNIAAIMIDQHLRRQDIT